MCWGFPQRNFAPGSPSNDDRQLGRPPASPLLSLLKRISLFQSRSLLFHMPSTHRFRSGNRLVNPDLAGKSRWFGSASYESAPGDVGKQHRAHPGVAAGSSPLGHSEPLLASTSLRRSDGAPRCTTEKNSDKKHDCLGCTQSGPGTPADTSWFGIGSRSKDYRPRRAADYAFS
jgi:hypothetical protein